MAREISRLKDYNVIKLEFRVNVQGKQIYDLKSRSVENSDNKCALRKNQTKIWQTL